MHRHRHPSTDTPQRNGQSWWCVTWRLAAILALGLALGTPPRAYAKIFYCGAGDVQCLIDAIHDANANGKKNTILLAAGTYTLTAVDNTTDGPNGLPSITSEFPLTIRGGKDEATIIERQPDAPGFRLIHVAATGTLALEGLTLRRGSGGGQGGGGIFNAGTLTLTHCTVSDNTASGGVTSTLGGGGIRNTGTLTLTHCTLSGNAAGARTGASGGGISNAGTLTLTHSTLSDNSTAGRTGGGGGIFNSGTLTLTNSTLSGNSFRLTGIFFGGGGGGIRNTGPLTLTNSTVSGNSIVTGNPSVSGGGILTTDTDTTVLLNTIVALNTALTGPDCAGSVTSQGHNLVGDPTDCMITLQASDLTGDPGLGPFTDNGRPGNGHFPLLPTSQAIDAGNDAVCPRRDQLGQRRIDIPDVGTSRCDIGAIEFQHLDKHQDDADHDQSNADHNQDDADSATAAQATP